MIESLKKMLGFGPATNYKQLMEEGAVILDVRTKAEYSGGHIRGSVNIPLDALRSNLGKLKDKDRPVITCCASGMRSAAAKSVLEANGFNQVYNGGGWSSLQRKLSSN